MLEEYKVKLKDIYNKLDVACKNARILELENISKEENFWQDKEYSNSVMSELADLKKQLNDYNEAEKKLSDLIELEKDEDTKELVVEELNVFKEELLELEEKTLFNGEYDKLNCILDIHPGAGGTESCDWADMLKRMYLRFCEKNNFAYEIIDEQAGDEAGIKSVSILIKGINAYGLFQSEKGVHRLVRISPFDSAKRRHTSFASVSICPEFDSKIDIDIKESDLKIDVYHSSGAGGQSVNTSDSAVRITHLPSKIVVTCQNERSQLKNKEKAMTVLKNKLYEIKIEEQNALINKEKGITDSINFGSQIRSYVLEPYTLVKDNRTNYETSSAQKVLDGDIKEFMIQYLKR